ncbi:hypothetical protein BJ508DRAFT_324485 [Ascobolus immersus RN42]|uniref:Uncharacterized protein n=1 Tax=Ascobolus immersus RN42 TaxID=1160509 RepID=A0A3N4IDA2_ASCIM|nr:hypothetical protein BJ508DRAFT_324485 [Ascobolus immersus RN42]
MGGKKYKFKIPSLDANAREDKVLRSKASKSDLSSTSKSSGKHCFSRTDVGEELSDDDLPPLAPVSAAELERVRLLEQAHLRDSDALISDKNMQTEDGHAIQSREAVNAPSARQSHPAEVSANTHVPTSSLPWYPPDEVDDIRTICEGIFNTGEAFLWFGPPGAKLWKGPCMDTLCPPLRCFDCKGGLSMEMLRSKQKDGQAYKRRVFICLSKCKGREFLSCESIRQMYAIYFSKDYESMVKYMSSIGDGETLNQIEQYSKWFDILLPVVKSVSEGKVSSDEALIGILGRLDDAERKEFEVFRRNFMDSEKEIRSFEEITGKSFFKDEAPPAPACNKAKNTSKSHETTTKAKGPGSQANQPTTEAGTEIRKEKPSGPSEDESLSSSVKVCDRPEEDLFSMASSKSLAWEDGNPAADASSLTNGSDGATKKVAGPPSEQDIRAALSTIQQVCQKGEGFARQNQELQVKLATREQVISQLTSQIDALQRQCKVDKEALTEHSRAYQTLRKELSLADELSSENIRLTKEVSDLKAALATASTDNENLREENEQLKTLTATISQLMNGFGGNN